MDSLRAQIEALGPEIERRRLKTEAERLAVAPRDPVSRATTTASKRFQLPDEVRVCECGNRLAFQPADCAPVQNLDGSVRGYVGVWPDRCGACERLRDLERVEAERRVMSEVRPCPCGGEIHYRPQIGDDGISRVEGGHWPSRCEVCREQARRERLRRDRLDWRNELRSRIASTLPKLYHVARLAHLSPQLRSKLVEAAAIPGRGAFVYGLPGRGKTYGLSGLIRWLICRRGGPSVRRVVFDDLLRDIRGTFSGSRSEDSVLYPYRDCDVLILEDIAAGSGSGGEASEFTSRILLAIIDARVEAVKQTFITSNLSVSEIETAFGGRVASRIRGACEIVKVGGPDLRGKRL